MEYKCSQPIAVATDATITSHCTPSNGKQLIVHNNSLSALFKGRSMASVTLGIKKELAAKIIRQLQLTASDGQNSFQNYFENITYIHAYIHTYIHTIIHT